MAPNQGARWLGLLWQAGVKPFGYDGDKGVTINVNSPEAKKVMAYWQDMIQNDLVSIDPDFTDEWYQGLNQGKYAGWLTAAWAPVFLSVPRLTRRACGAPRRCRSGTRGKPASGNWGGSADAVLKTLEEPDRGLRAGEVDQQRAGSGVAVRDQAVLLPDGELGAEDPTFVDDKPEFYGGQKVNELFADISTTVDTDWQWLPFMEFAYSSFNETFGAAVAAKGDLACRPGCLAERARRLRNPAGLHGQRIDSPGGPGIAIPGRPLPRPEEPLG